MPTTTIEAYFPVLVQVLLGVAVGAALVGMGVFLGKRLKNKVKDLPYECGIPAVGSAKERFSVKFYLVAMLFILFDIEAIFLYPWAVNFRELGWFGYGTMALFASTLVLGLVYVWKKGALTWES